MAVGDLKSYFPNGIVVDDTTGFYTRNGSTDTQITASAAELNYLDITATGAVQASKAVVVDSNKDIGDFRNLDAVNIDAGASGTAGTVDIFPATAAKGKVALTAADSAGDTTTTIVNASQAGARTYTIPDAGASASFLMTEGAQTKNANLTLGTGADLLFSGTTGQSEIQLTDNLADALSVKIASGNDMLVFDTTDNAEVLTVVPNTNVTGRVTTTDGVTSGTARVVGGRAYSAVSATDNLLASAGATAHVDFAQTYSIPANTLKANSILKIRYQVAVTNDSGTDTLETKLYLGGTTLMTTTAFDPSAATDFVIGEFEVVARAAPGASASCAGCGRWVTSDNGSLVHGAAIMAPTNFATNGALVVKVSAAWSATTADTNARLEILNVEIV